MEQANQTIEELQEKLKQLLQSDFQIDEQPESLKLLGQKLTPPTIDYEEFIEYTRGDLNVYDNYLLAMQPLVKDLHQKLERFFRLNHNPRWQSGFDSGRKLDLTALMQAEASQAPVLDIWQKRDLPRRRNYAFSLLLDCSGSMTGTPFTESCKGMIVFLEALELLKIETQLIFFGDSASIIKDWQDVLNNQRRQYISQRLPS